jgi:hypothetical protein
VPLAVVYAHNELLTHLPHVLPPPSSLLLPLCMYRVLCVCVCVTQQGSSTLTSSVGRGVLAAAPVDDGSASLASTLHRGAQGAAATTITTHSSSTPVGSPARVRLDDPAAAAGSRGIPRALPAVDLEGVGNASTPSAPTSPSRQYHASPSGGRPGPASPGRTMAPGSTAAAIPGAGARDTHARAGTGAPSSSDAGSSSTPESLAGTTRRVLSDLSGPPARRTSPRAVREGEGVVNSSHAHLYLSSSLGTPVDALLSAAGDTGAAVPAAVSPRPSPRRSGPRRPAPLLVWSLCFGVLEHAWRACVCVGGGPGGGEGLGVCACVCTCV